MTPWKYMYLLSGSRVFRHRCYIVAGLMEAAALAVVAGVIGWLIQMRPEAADGVAGFSERHALGPFVRYLSLDDEAMINAAVIGLMLTTALVVIMLGWLWHRRLTHILPQPDVAVLDNPDDHAHSV
jgi:hypothetical protein